MASEQDQAAAQEFGALLEGRILGRRFNNPLEAAGELEDTVVDLLRDWKDHLPPKETVVIAVGGVYDRFVAPIDIRFIPNFIEPAVDAMLRRYLISAVDGIYDRILGGA